MGRLTPEVRAALEVLREAAVGPDSAFGPIAILGALDKAGLLRLPGAPVWSVWEEEEPTFGLYVSEAAAQEGSIRCYEKRARRHSPDYSWVRHGDGEVELELVAGGELAGIFISLETVQGQPEAEARQVVSVSRPRRRGRDRWVVRWAESDGRYRQRTVPRSAVDGLYADLHRQARETRGGYR